METIYRYSFYIKTKVIGKPLCSNEYLDNPKLAKVVDYKLVSKIQIKGEKSLCACLDGEVFHWDKIQVEVLPKVIKMIFPKE